MKYACSGCGQCCMKVGQNIEILKKIGFPYESRANGACEKYDEETKKCTVYRYRPDVCNVDKMYYLMHGKTGKTKKEVFLDEAKICNQWIGEAGLPKEYLIDEKQYQ